MAHEVSLYMGDVAKMHSTKRLAHWCHELYKWIMNHTRILGIFRDKVKAHFEAKMKDPGSDAAARKRCASRATMVLYKRGNT